MLRLLELHCLLEFPGWLARRLPALRRPALKLRASAGLTDSDAVECAERGDMAVEDSTADLLVT